MILYMGDGHTATKVPRLFPVIHGSYNVNEGCIMGDVMHGLWRHTTTSAPRLFPVIHGGYNINA